MNNRETVDWGIDLGTTNSSIAVFEGRGVKIIENNKGNKVTPSAVYETKANGSIVRYVGQVAKNKVINDSDHVALEFKQKMGMKDWYFEFPTTGRKATAVELSAEVLKELIRSVKQRVNEDVYAALITVPAAFLNPMYTDTKRAGEIAGLKYVEVLEEPVAAALAYGLNADTKRKAIWLAYDLGGGTFDAALVKMEDGEFNVFGHKGLPYLGGKNLDAAIVDEYLVPALPDNIRGKAVPWRSSQWYILKSEAEIAKIELSTLDEFTIDCIIDGHTFVYKLTRDSLNKLEDKIFSETIKTCKELLVEKGFEAKHIEKVILIGGPTLSPHLRKTIENGLQIPIDFSANPLTAVAEGAAVYAASRKIPIKPHADDKPIGDISIDINYEPTSNKAEEELVAGKLISKNKDVQITPEWSVEISRVNKAGDVVWASGSISLTENGGFAVRVPLEEGENIFRIIAKDGTGRIVDINKTGFRIVVTIKSRPELPRGIGVADAFGEFIEFFKQGERLPAKKTLTLSTTKPLAKGMKGEVINIPIVEGNEKIADLNWHIDTLKIEADKLTENIPSGSSVDVTVSISESREIEVAAYFEDYDVQTESIMAPDVGYDTKKIVTETNKIKDTLSKLKMIQDLDPDIRKIIKDVDQNKLVEEIESLFSQASKEMPEPAQKAQEKILELRKKLSPIIETGSELLKWKPHKEYCDKNVDKAKFFVNNERDVSSDWKRQFEELLNEYEQAMASKDYKKTEEIAYSLIPDLFMKDQIMKDYVNPSGPGEKGKAEKIEIGKKGDIKIM